MKLAEALSLRADIQKRLEQLKARLLRNAKVQEGDQPAEDPAALLAEYENASAELVQLIRRVNLTNATCNVSGQTMTEALAVRDTLKMRHGLYRDLAQAATITQSVATRSEVRFKGTVSVAAVQRQADDVAKEFRELDAHPGGELADRFDGIGDVGSRVERASTTPPAGQSRNGRRSGQRRAGSIPAPHLQAQHADKRTTHRAKRTTMC